MIKSLSVRLCVLVYVKGQALNVLCVYVGGGVKESFTIGWEQIFFFFIFLDLLKVVSMLDLLSSTLYNMSMLVI